MVWNNMSDLNRACPKSVFSNNALGIAAILLGIPLYLTSIRRLVTRG